MYVERTDPSDDVLLQRLCPAFVSSALAQVLLGLLITWGPGFSNEGLHCSKQMCSCPLVCSKDCT